MSSLCVLLNAHLIDYFLSRVFLLQMANHYGLAEWEQKQLAALLQLGPKKTDLWSHPEEWTNVSSTVSHS